MKLSRKTQYVSPLCGSGEALVVGTRQIRKALLRQTAVRVYLAQNADPAVTAPIEELCRQNHIQPISVSTMAALGRLCQIEVGAAAAAVVR